jgi:hypothetical protein
MLSVLANRTYRHLFAGQVIALIGTGMMTVALGLLAFKIAGDKAGAVLGTALARTRCVFDAIADHADALIHAKAIVHQEFGLTVRQANDTIRTVNHGLLHFSLAKSLN